jgi:hypothetical protein
MKTAPVTEVGLDFPRAMKYYADTGFLLSLHLQETTSAALMITLRPAN